MSLITIITDPLKGGTFLAWTMHFLAGHRRYYSTKKQQWIDLPDNPLTEINAHGFKPNKPDNFEELCQCLDQLPACEATQFHTVYFHHFSEYPYNSKFSETTKGFEKILPLTHKLVVLTNQSSNLLYEKSYRTRVKNMKSLKDPKILHAGDKAQFDDFVKFFFNDSLEVWNQLNLRDIWDTREFLALNYRHHTFSMESLIDLSVPHYSLDCIEWFTTADGFIQDLCNYLEINPAPERLATWKQIYESWRKKHYQRLNFLWSFHKIVNYIVNGNYMDLARFDLDIYQEAIIQHDLIYKHNLNLKTFNLERFNNTQQLHNLLEPNTHDLSKSKQ
jgi:hypothetical protein